MRFQDYVIQTTERAVEDLFRTARAVPEDKLNWKPMDNGRSTLSVLQECAQFPLIAVPMLLTRQMPPFTHDVMVKAIEERSKWETLEECEEICRNNSEELYKAIREFPDSDLQHTIVLPFGGGMVRSMADIMMMHYWNTTYHFGQLNYLQTLLGDKEMH